MSSSSSSSSSSCSMTSTTSSMLLSPILNSPALLQAGLADVSHLDVHLMSVVFVDYLQDQAASAGEPIDRGQAMKFLSHMVRTLGLSSDDLVLMRAFVGRYHEHSKSTLLNDQKACLEGSRTSSSSSSPTHPTMTFGMQLLLSAYCSQTLQYDEPLAKSSWTMYSRMPWDEFLHQLFTFTGTFGMDLSVSVQQWNAAAWSLTPGHSSGLLSTTRGASFSLAPAPAPVSQSRKKAPSASAIASVLAGRIEKRAVVRTTEEKRALAVAAVASSSTTSSANCSPVLVSVPHH